MLIKGSGTSCDTLIGHLLSTMYSKKKALMEHTRGLYVLLRRFFRKICIPNYVDFGDDFDIEAPFHKQSIRTRAKILYHLCYFQFQFRDTSEIWRDCDEDFRRTEPVGVDSSGYSYWYFWGKRLYRSKGELWEVACYNFYEWNDIISKLKLSAKEDDIELAKALRSLRC